MSQLLLLSNSTTHGYAYLEHARDGVSDMLSGCGELLFVPYALADHAGYTRRVAEALTPLGVEVRGLHTCDDPAAAVADAQAVFTGGGNTFRLLRQLYRLDLLQPLRDRVAAGMPYLGASAGTNIASPTMRTTNDMPIVEPPSLSALGLVPFQINPHYLDPAPGNTHMGETREERITQFHEENDVAVLGMREGTWLRVRDGSAVLGGAPADGSDPARWFTAGQPAHEVSGDISELMEFARHVSWG